MEMTMLADWTAATCTDQTHCLVYADGVILSLAVGEDTHRAFLELVRGVRLAPPEWGRSRNGFSYAYGFRGDPEVLEARLYVVLEGLGLIDGAAISDNRRRNSDTIDLSYAMLQESQM